MFDVTSLFDPTGFNARWYCGTGWTRPLGWTHVVADVATAVAYFAVPTIVLLHVARRPDVRLPRSFWVLLTLIFASCGLVHLVESLIFWWPVYRLSAVLKVATAIVSCSGVVLLVRVLPTALSLKHPEELRREVAERERAEARLHEERFLLETLLDQLPDVIYFKDVEGRFVRVSRALAYRLGLDDPAHAVGLGDADFFPEAYARRTHEDERRLMASREPVVGKEERPRWPNGGETWVSTTKSPLVSPEGTLLGTMGISHDVTELKEQQAALRESEERYELAVRGSTDGLWDWNVTTDAVYYSPRFRELLGYDEAEFPDHFESFESRLHPKDRRPTLEAIRRHLEEREPYDVEYRLLTGAGTYRWFRARGQAVWDAAGLPCRMAGSITDVTERRQAEERFRLAVEASPSGMLIVDDEGRILLANSQIERLFGHTREALSAKTVEELVPDGARADHAMLRAAYFENPVPRPMGSGRDLRARRRDGSEFDVEIGLSPLRSDTGTTVLCSVVDVTERKRNLEVLRAAKESAEAANRAKSEFLAAMSHEIRTPMNAIIGMTELVLDTDLSSRQRDYLATVADSADALMATINEILDFSKIEAGELSLENVPFSLRELLGDTMRALSHRAHEKGLELAWQVAPEVPDGLRGDPTRLRQVLVNLVGNAVKFTERGEVVVRVDPIRSPAEGAPNGGVDLSIRVRDTGIGIPADRQRSIFEAFTQADMSTTRRFGGTGLGLSISATIVERMGGRIDVESEVDVGTTFTVILRLDRASRRDFSRAPTRAELAGLTVLVVDDNATNRRILDETLTSWGVEVLLAASGSAALETFDAVAAGTIDLVVTDVHMPGMDGFEFLDQLRRRVGAATPPAIVLTSALGPANASRDESLGVAVHLAKPVKQSELLEAIGRAVGVEEEDHEAETRTVDGPTTRPLRVLLAEDGLANQKLAIGLLESWGHSVVVAENGRVAVDEWSSGDFDVVLMDVNMPEMDGLDATREIRRREAGGGRIPIVAMTAHAMKGDRERCLEAGMDEYLSKPIRRDEFARVLAELFTER